MTAVLFDSALKVCVVMLVGLVATALLRRQSAALRHSVLSAGILGAAVTPLLSTVVPRWEPPARVADNATLVTT